MNDLISREAAIDALKRAEALTRAFGYHTVIETIRELPSAQPDEPKLTWTPTNKSLPDKQGTYLITTCKGRVYLWSYYPEMDKNWKRFVLAWCNLPHPYKE